LQQTLSSSGGGLLLLLLLLALRIIKLLSQRFSAWTTVEFAVDLAHRRCQSIVASRACKARRVPGVGIELHGAARDHWLVAAGADDRLLLRSTLLLLALLLCLNALGTHGSVGDNGIATIKACLAFRAFEACGMPFLLHV
jgi:hypothetical protein